MIIPNIITISGLIIVLFSLYKYYITNNYIYIIIAFIGFSCDFWDGYIARKYNMSSNIGNTLDKMVDKINQIGILLLLIIRFNISPIYLFIYILREIIMYIMRKNNMKPVSSSFYGKLKTFLFPILLILFHYNIIYRNIYLDLLTIFNFVTLLL